VSWGTKRFCILPSGSASPLVAVSLYCLIVASSPSGKILNFCASLANDEASCG
jgi:hypothetical protein